MNGGVPGAGKCNPYTTGFNRIDTRKIRAQNLRNPRKSMETHGNQQKSCENQRKTMKIKRK